MEIELLTDKPPRDPGEELMAEATESIPEPMGIDSWAAQPLPRRGRFANRDGFDLDAVKIFLILAGLTAGMALALRSLF